MFSKKWIAAFLAAATILCSGCGQKQVQKADSNAALSMKRHIVRRLEAADRPEYESIVNSNLMAASMYYYSYAKKLNQLTPETDYAMMIEGISYNPDSLRIMPDGASVAEGSIESINQSFLMRAGCAVNDDSMWYLTLTFSGNSGVKTILYNTLALVLGATHRGSGANIGEDEDERFENAQTIVDALIEYNSEAAIQVGDLVFFRTTDSASNSIVVGVDSVSFYDHSGAPIANYLKADF